MKSRSISYDLGWWFLLILLIPMFISYQVATTIFSRHIKEDKRDNLVSLANATHERIEAYVRSLINDATTFARLPILSTLLKEENHILTPAAHVVNFLEDFRQHRGYYDILLLDINGTIRYSLLGEADLGLNVHDTELRKSALPSLLDAANTLLQTEASQFDYYPPPRTTSPPSSPLLFLTMEWSSAMSCYKLTGAT
jgi:two-component system, NtrC family, sensor kinase